MEQTPTRGSQPCAKKEDGPFPSRDSGGGGGGRRPRGPPRVQVHTTGKSRSPCGSSQEAPLVPLNFPPQVSRFCLQKTELKDYALPNASWCPDMLSLYQEFLEKTKTDDWVKIPSFKSNKDHIRGLKLPFELAVTSGKAWPERAAALGPSRPAQPPSLCSEALGSEGHEPPTQASARVSFWCLRPHPTGAAAPGR